MLRKMPERRTRSFVARGLHGWALVLSAGLSVGTTACVVPPPLGLDQPDAGANASPVFLSIRGPDGKELAQPGPVNIVQLENDDATITAYDADAGDTLTVQVFVDYSEKVPTAPRSTCTASPSTDSSLERTLSCPLKAICLPTDVTTGNPHFMTFEIYDRPVINDPLMFRSVAPPGQLSNKSYLLTCLAPTQ
jgi:hypothetical protein